jgi:hypothetical protein
MASTDPPRPPRPGYYEPKAVWTDAAMKDPKRMKKNHEAIADIEAVVKDPIKWEWHGEGHCFARGSKRYGGYRAIGRIEAPWLVIDITHVLAHDDAAAQKAIDSGRGGSRKMVKRNKKRS